MQKRSILLKFSKDFQKEVSRLNRAQLNQLTKRLALFRNDPGHPKLRKHKLYGRMKGFYSINISGDLRAIYYLLKENKYELIVGFTRLGTHSQLY